MVEIQQIQELSSNMAELNQSVNELLTMTEQQVKEISPNVDELSTLAVLNSASINQLTVGVEAPEGFVSTSIAPSCSSIIQHNPFSPSGYNHLMDLLFVCTVT